MKREIEEQVIQEMERRNLTCDYGYDVGFKQGAEFVYSLLDKELKRCAAIAEADGKDYFELLNENKRLKKLLVRARSLIKILKVTKNVSVK